MNPTLILLGGGRGNWPNIWSVLAYQPRQVLLLTPRGDERQTESLVRWLQSRGIQHRVLPPVDALDAALARTACARALKDLPQGEPVYVNATQGPKPMAIGACQAVWKAQRPEVIPFYLDTAGAKVRSLALGGEMPADHSCRPTLEDFLAAFGRQAVVKNDLGPLEDRLETLVQLARLMADPRCQHFIRDLRKQVGQEGNSQRRVSPGRVNDFSRLLLQRLAEEGLVHHPSPNSLCFQVADNHALRFLTGGWLELLAFAAARDCRHPVTGHLEFCDVRCNVEIPSATTNYELDLVALDPYGMLLYASCKTSEPSRRNQGWATDYLNEVADRANLLGGGYCARALILGTSLGRVPQSFRNQAAERRITLLTVEDFSILSHQLAQAMQTARQSAR